MPTVGKLPVETGSGDFVQVSEASYNFGMNGSPTPPHQMLAARYLPWPVDWARLFGREGPLLLEIGFGGGHFLVNLAQKRPFANIVGVEISLPSLQRGEQKIKRAGLANVRVVQGSAELFLWALCTPASLAGLFINFPDPWPKASHHRRRLINAHFLHLAATRMKPDATLDIATDHDDYAAVITDCLQHTPYFDSRIDLPFVHEDKERLRTKYELTGLAAGRRCHYYFWQRNRVTAANQFPTPEEVEMPHIIMESTLSLSEISRQFEPLTAVHDSTNVSLSAIFVAVHHDSLLVEVYINEAPLKQRVALQIRRRAQGDIVVGLHELGFPRPTRGVQLAIARLGQWLLSLHPDMKMTHSNLQFVVP